MTGSGTRRRSMVEERESTVTGRIEMAAARACVQAVDLMNRAVEASGRSQRSVAQSLGVTDGRISQVLNGDGNLQVATLARLLRAAGYQLRLEGVPAEEGARPIGLAGLARRRRGSVALKATRSFHVTSTVVATAGEDGVGMEEVIVLSKSPWTAIMEPIQVGPSTSRPTRAPGGSASVTIGDPA